MKEYKIIRGTFVDTLETQMNELAVEGWRPVTMAPAPGRKMTLFICLERG